MANKLLQQLVKKRVLSKAKESNLKAATPVVEDPTLQTWIKDVTSTVKEMASSGVRRSDLVKAGIAVINNGELQTALKPDEEFNLTVPAAVMNLTANGAYSSITLTWTTKASKYFGMNIIYRSDVDDFGTATQIGSSAGDVYTDYVGNNIKAYYWVRTVSMYGVEGELAPSVSAETAIDVEYLLEQITGQINESHLDELLRSDLSSIDEIEAALLAESAARIEAIKQKAIELSNMAATLRQELESKIGMIVADLNLKTADLNIKTTNLDQKAVDLDQRVAGLKEEVSSLISSVNEQVSSLSTAIQADIDALNDGLTQEIKSRTDGDKSITTSLNAYKQSNDNAVAVILDKAETAISSSSATATDVTALQTRMTTAEGNINKKTDATAFNALTTKVNGLDDKVEVNSSSITSLTANLETVTDTADTALSTASSAKSTAESAVTQNTALSQRVDSLAASITDLGEGAETNVDVYAFNALKAEVTSQGNEIDANTTDISDHTKKINANTQSITSLGSRLTTAEGKVTGNTTAINSVKTTQTTQGNQISQAVEDITALENSIETITDDLSAKADASTVSSLTNDVTSLDGKIKTTADSLLALTNKVGTVEGNLSKKVDSTALVNYYTTTQTDSKILETTAGEISKYDASLSIGGVNLLTTAELTAGDVLNRLASTHTFVDDPTCPSGNTSVVKVTSSGGTGGIYANAGNASNNNKDEIFTASVWLKGEKGGERVYITEGHTAIPAGSNAFTLTTTWKRYSCQVKRNTDTTFNFVIYCTTGAGSVFYASRIQYEKGTKMSAWSHPQQVLKDAVNANATAISTTNAEVLKQDGRITANSNRIDNLSTSIDNLSGSKLDASVIAGYYTKGQADSKAAEIAAGKVDAFKASLNVGGVNMLSDSDKSGSPVILRSTATSFSQYKISSDPEYVNTPITQDTQVTLTIWYLEHSEGFGTSKPFTSVVIGKTATSDSWSVRLYRSNTKITKEGAYFKCVGTLNLSAGSTLLNNGGIIIILEDTSQTTGMKLVRAQLEYGNVATAWSPNPSDVKSGIDANASAISATNAEVLKQDGRITANSNRIDNLSTSINNLSGSKLDASVIAGYYTKAQTDNKIETVSAGKVESFSASLSFDNTNLLRNTSVERTITGSNTTNQGVYYVPFNKNTLGETLRDFSVGDSITLSFRWEAESGSKGTVRPQVNGVPYVVAGGSFEVSATNLSGYYTATSKISQAMLDSTGTSMGFRLDSFVGKIKIKEWMLQHSSKATGWEPSYLDVQNALDANATAIQSTNAEVTRVDGRVTTESNRITALTGRMSVVEGAVNTKADVSALNSLTARVGNVEGGLSTQASSITSLEAGLRSAASTALDLIPNPTFDPLYNQMGFNVVSSSLSSVPSGCPYPYVARLASRDHSAPLNSMPGIACKQGDVFEMSVLVACGAGSADFNLYVYKMAAITAGTSALASGGNTKTTSAWKRVTWRWTVPAGCYFFKPFLQINQNSPFSTVWYATDWHCINVTAAAQVKTTADATASALSTLDTRVEQVDGKVSSQASQILTLTSDNTANKNALQVQAKVINGVKANYVVKMETNGVIGGFGMIQEAGTLGQVRTEFGIRADRFYVVPPGQDLTKGVVPFVIDNNKVIIDVALIKDGSITNAKIGNLAADKITTGDIAADRMKVNIVKAVSLTATNLESLNLKVKRGDIEDLAVDTLKIANNAVTVPVAVTTAAAITVGNAYTSVQSLNVPSDMGHTLLTFGAVFSFTGYSPAQQILCRILKNNLPILEDIEVHFVEHESIAKVSAYGGKHGHTATVDVTVSIDSAGSHGHGHSLSTNDSGSHGHSFNGSTGYSNSHSHSVSGSVGSTGSHSHSVNGSISSDGSHSHNARASADRLWIGESGEHNHNVTIQGATRSAGTINLVRHDSSFVKGEFTIQLRAAQGGNISVSQRYIHAMTLRK